MIQTSRRQCRHGGRMIAPIETIGKNLIHHAVGIPGRHRRRRIIHGNLPVVLGHGSVFDALAAEAVARSAITDGPIFVPDQKAVPNQPRFSRYRQIKPVPKAAGRLVDRDRVQDLLTGCPGPGPQPHRLRQRLSIGLQIKIYRRSTGNRPVRTTVVDTAGIVAKSVPHSAPR